MALRRFDRPAMLPAPEQIADRQNCTVRQVNMDHLIWHSLHPFLVQAARGRDACLAASVWPNLRGTPLQSGPGNTPNWGCSTWRPQPVAPFPLRVLSEDFRLDCKSFLLSMRRIEARRKETRAAFSV